MDESSFPEDQRHHACASRRGNVYAGCSALTFLHWFIERKNLYCHIKSHIQVEDCPSASASKTLAVGQFVTSMLFRPQLAAKVAILMNPSRFCWQQSDSSIGGTVAQ